jgi:DNA-binding transcriptional LysR family regulator
MIETNRGATILPWLTVAGEAHFKPGLVRPFERPTPTRTIRLVYPRRLEFSPMIQALALEFRQAVLPLLPPDHHFSEAPAYDERAL